MDLPFYASHKGAPPGGRIALALFLVQFLFGINYVISKVIIGSFPPLVWASIRILIATAVLFAFCLLTRRPHPKGGFKDYFLPVMGLSLLGCVINQTSFLVGLSYTTPTNSAILNTLIPIFTLLVVTLRGQEPLTTNRMIGFVCAFAGVLVLRKVEEFHFSDQTLIGDLLTMLNCLSYAFFLSYGKKLLEKHDRMWTTSYLFLFGSIAITVIALPSFSTFEWPVMTRELWICAVIAILGGTLLTYFLNNWALAYTKSSQVALWIYVQPVIAAGLAWAWLGQGVSPRTIFSSLFIFFGVVIAIGPENLFGKSRTAKASH
jgi:drug/metabolite transporter (DMT)-like permease